MSNTSTSGLKTFKTNLFGPFYSLTRTKSVELTFDHDSPTVKEMLLKLVERYPKMEEYIFEDGRLAEFTTIVINGDLVSDQEWDDIHIKPEDRVSLFKGQHGG
ncbi:MAG: MoaD/ThiS family protein [Promethearchaeota archaeon]